MNSYSDYFYIMELYKATLMAVIDTMEIKHSLNHLLLLVRSKKTHKWTEVMYTLLHPWLS